MSGYSVERLRRMRALALRAALDYRRMRNMTRGPSKAFCRTMLQSHLIHSGSIRQQISKIKEIMI
jgi:hypothetical protein